MGRPCPRHEHVSAETACEIPHKVLPRKPGKRMFVKWFRDVISAVDLRVLLRSAWRLQRWRARPGWAGCGHAAGHPGLCSRARVRRCGLRPGALTDVAQAGLGSLTAFNRGGEGPRARAGELLWVSGEVVLDVLAGSLPAGERPGCWRGRGYADLRQPGLGLRGHGVVVTELAGGDPGIPAGAVHHQRPDPAQQGRGARHAGLVRG